MSFQDVPEFGCLSDDNDDDDEPGPATSTPKKKKTDRQLDPVVFQPPQLPRQPCPAAPPLTPNQKKRHSTQGTPSPARKKPRNRSITSTESGGEDRWHDKEKEDIQPDPPRFRPLRTPGPTFDTTRPWSPTDLFRLFFSASVVKRIIENTNANAARRKLAGMAFKWDVLTDREFNTFLAIIIFTGLVSVHHRSDYWRTSWPYNFHFPREKMTRSRFESILWSLHMSNPKEDEENEKKRNTPEFDRLFKIKPLYTEMVNTCKALFQPHQNLSIDERMVASRARISFRQYIKNKPKKWGYKLFVLADSSTGYTWNFSVYSGKKYFATADSESLSYSAVMDLLTFPLIGSGYKLFTDNWYTSPTLFNDLIQKNIGCCGTMRKNHSGIPQTEINALPKRPERGDLRWIRSGDLLFVKWMDTKEVPMCSSLHQAYSGQTVDRRVKEDGVWINKPIPVPDCILDYNKNMGGVDLSNALIENYTVRHKTTKWYKTFFYHFLDIAVVNSYLLHKELFKIRQDPGQKRPFTHKTFREQLAKELLELAEDSDTTPAVPPSTCMPAFFQGEESRTRKHCRRCIETGKPRVKTAAFCSKCNVPLCLSAKKNCFQLWHDGL